MRTRSGSRSRSKGSGSRPIRGGPVGGEDPENPSASPSRNHRPFLPRRPQASDSTSSSTPREPPPLPPWLPPMSGLDESSWLLATPRAKPASTLDPTARRRRGPAAGETPTTSASARWTRRATESRASEFDSSLPPPQLQLPDTEPSNRRRSERKKSAECASQEEKAKKPRQEASASAHEELATEQLDSDSSYSSPLREPKPPLVQVWTTPSTGKVLYSFTKDQAAVDTYYRDFDKYQQKLARQEELATLTPSLGDSGCYTYKQKKTFLNAAKSVLGLSAYHDDEEINQCTGIIVEWDEVKKSAIVLTSAWIICTKKPFDDWSDKDYAPEAKVIVHLLDGTMLEAQLLYFSKHYDIAFFEVMGGSQFKVFSLEPSVEFGQEVCVLAREENQGLICRRTTVESLDPCEHQHNHYLFIDVSIPKCGTGGALVDFNGKIVGMVFYTLPFVAFLPSSLILKCLTLWKKFGQVARPQLGLKLRTVDFLDIPHIEKLSRSFGISSGLIVGEVSAQCVAEKLGIRVGDVVLSCQGESVSSIPQLEDILLGIVEKHLEKSNDLSSKVDVEVGVYQVRKYRSRVITLTLELSDGIEVFS